MSTPDIVLVIDDERAITEMIADVLGDEGYKVVGAHRGDEALALLESVRPDVILLDLYMPWIDGATLLARLRAYPTLADVPIVVMSASSTTAEPLMLPGATAALVKPFEIHVLLESVASALRSRTSTSTA
jgi:DNA-binding response OmpR family regulator